MLIPQPDNDPHDPLNWSPMWKALVIIGGTLTAFVHQFGPLSIASQVPYYVKDFHHSETDILQFTGIFVVVLGVSALIWVPFSTKYGRRAVLLACTIIGLFDALWRALAKSYGSMLAAAAINGISGGASQILPAALVSDVMFLHERGLYMGIFTCSLFGSLAIGPVVSGVMSQEYNWRSYWWVDFAMFACLLVWIIFFIPETKWHRNPEKENIHPDTLDATADNEKTNAVEHVETTDNEKSATPEQAEVVSTTTSTEFLGTGGPSKRQFMPFQNDPAEGWKNVLRPFWVPAKLCYYPIVIWASFCYSGGACLTIIVNMTQSMVFAAPPYNFSSSAVGYSNFATLGGIMVGLLTAGPLSDWICKKMTIRNNGIREPEMRLFALIPYFVFMTIGCVITGVGYEKQWQWPVILVCGWGFMAVATASVTTIGMTYAVDCYKPVTGDLFVLASLVKDLWAYGVTHWLPDWIESSGDYISPIMICYFVSALPVVLAIPLYFCGKQFRRWTRNSFVHSL